MHEVQSMAGAVKAFWDAAHQNAALSTALTRQAVSVSGLASVVETAKPIRRLPGVDPHHMYVRQPSYKIWRAICRIRYDIRLCSHSISTSPVSSTYNTNMRLLACCQSQIFGRQHFLH